MIEQRPFGTLADGQTVESIKMTNGTGMSVTLLTLGATIQKWQLADEQRTDIVLGFDTLEDYLKDAAYLGRTVGRYANRICDGQFSIAQKSYQVTTNLQGNALHGGVNGFHNRLWQVVQLDDGDAPQVTLALVSEDGDQGFPGKLEMQVCFTLDDTDTLTIEYRAQTDQDTVFNPTQHSYFNLAGHDSGPVGDQCLQVFASHYTPADDRGIPSGEIRAVQGGPFDLTKERPITQVNSQADPEIQSTEGLDHNFCLDGFDPSQQQSRLVAVAHAPKLKRKLLTRSTMPGAQIYTANFLGADPQGKNQTPYGQYHGFCIETQFYPDAPNQPHFPSALLLKGQQFYSVTSYQVVQES